MTEARQEAEDEGSPNPSRCGFVALIGAPNSGKSTLLNTLVGTKLSIVTHKVQTTRFRLRGIASRGTAQIIFIDTPGIFSPKRRLERAMVEAAWAGVDDADAVVLLFDASRKSIDADTLAIVETLAAKRRRVLLALNKIDLVRREALLGLAARFQEFGVFSDIFMISALTGDGVEDLMRTLADAMPEGPWHYPEDQLSDLPQRLLAAETTREKLFLALHEELPYALTVETESWQEFEDGSVRIEQVVTVQRDTQKAIVIGKGGRTIKAVREKAQAELEGALGRKVHLFIFVKVRENWLEDPARYRDWGLDFGA